MLTKTSTKIKKHDPGLKGKLLDLSKKSTESLFSNSSEFLSISNEAIALAHDLKDYETVARRFLDRATYSAKLSEFTQAETELEAVEKILDKLIGNIHTEIQARITSARGSFKYRQGELIEAIQLTKQALSVVEGIENLEDFKSSAHNNLAVMYCHLGDRQAGFEQLGNALRITPNKSGSSYLRALYNLGTMCVAAGDINSARAYLEEALAHDTPELEVKAQIANLASKVSIVTNSLDEARAWCERSLEAAYGSGSVEWIGFALSELGNLHLKLGNYDQAIQIYRDALRQSLLEEFYCEIFASMALAEAKKITTLKKGSMECCTQYINSFEELLPKVPEGARLWSIRIISEVYALLGKYDAAYEAHKLSYEIQERAFSAQVISELGSIRLLMKIEREEHERKLEAMKHEQIEKELANSTMHLAMQTELLGNFRNRLRQIVREIDEPLAALKKIKEELKTLPCESVDWAKFESEFISVHPEFRSTLIGKYPDLTKQEVKMCQLARLGLKNIEIAQLLCLSERSVENHRFNLRKKLGLKTEQNLTQFLATIK